MNLAWTTGRRGAASLPNRAWEPRALRTANQRQRKLTNTEEEEEGVVVSLLGRKGVELVIGGC